MAWVNDVLKTTRQFMVSLRQNYTLGTSTSTRVLLLSWEENPLTWMMGYSPVDMSPPNTRHPTWGWLVAGYPTTYPFTFTRHGMLLKLGESEPSTENPRSYGQPAALL